MEQLSEFIVRSVVGEERAEKLHSKYVAYGFEVVKQVLCIPSNLILLSIWAPTNYESKLWDLKLHLDRLQHTQSTASDQEMFEYEIESFAKRYKNLTSQNFRSFLDVMMAKGVRGVIRPTEMPQKYIYFVSSEVNWELVRLQSCRYVWNQTDQAHWYGLFLSTALVFQNKTNVEHNTLISCAFLQNKNKNAKDAKDVKDAINEFISKQKELRGVGRLRTWMKKHPIMCMAGSFAIVYVNGENFVDKLRWYSEAEDRTGKEHGV